MRDVILICALVFNTAMSARAAPAAEPPKVELASLTAELRKTPDDSALREKIIKLAAGMKPAPVVPDEAERRMARGKAAFKLAKEPAEIADAAVEFRKATLEAPWWADAYYNLGQAQDKSGDYSGAIRNLKFYLLAAPDAPDAKEVKSLIYEIEYKQEKAAKESSAEMLAARARAQKTEFARSLEGASFIAYNNTSVFRREWTIVVRQGRAVWGQETTWMDPRWGEPIKYAENCSAEIEDRVFRCKFQGFDHVGTFDENGKRAKVVLIKDGMEEFHDEGCGAGMCWYNRR